MKVYEVHEVFKDGSSRWNASFWQRYMADDFVKMYRAMYSHEIMFSITEVNK